MTRRVGRVLLSGIALVAPLAGLAGAKPPPREVPANVAIHSLLEFPDRYDGRRVLVTGFISSITLEQGRRGSEYAVIVLEETVTGPPVTAYTVKVISATMPNVQRCKHALVQGVYHRAGKQGGRPYEFFIDADAVLEGEAGVSGRVPSECEEKL